MTRSILEDLIKDIAKELNLSTSRDEAYEKQQARFLFLDYAYTYGGWQIVYIRVNGGGHFSALGLSAIEWLSGKEMFAALNGILCGIKLARQLQQA